MLSATERHMKLTTQLVSFITLCVISAMAVVMLGGVFSFRQMGMELQQNRVDSLVEIIDKQLARPGVLAVLLPRAEAERVVQLLDDLAGRLADETATAAALNQLEATL